MREVLLRFKSGKSRYRLVKEITPEIKEVKAKLARNTLQGEGVQIRTFKHIGKGPTGYEVYEEQ